MKIFPIHFGIFPIQRGSIRFGFGITAIPKLPLFRYTKLGQHRHIGVGRGWIDLKQGELAKERNAKERMRHKRETP